MTTALAGIQVLDFSTGLSGAIASMVLCDNGADVIKVEPPGGDPDRALPAWVQWHRGQQSVELDLTTTAGQARARELAENADVVIESWLPGTAESNGLGYETLAASNPALVYCAITGFGPKGPMADVKGYDAIVGAKVGVMGYADRPRFAAVPGGSYAASQGALQGILAALYVRGATGKGQKVETSIVQGLTGYELYNWLGPQLPKQLAEQPRTGSTFAMVSGVVGFTKDGRWLQFANFRPHLVDAFLAATGLTDEYKAAVERKANYQEMNELVLRRLHEKTLDEWMDIFMQSDDIGVEPFRTPMEALDHPQVIHNGNVIDVNDPVLGKTRQVGPLARLFETPAEPKEGAPKLGEHNDSASFTKRADSVALQTPPPGPRGPLDGVTVIELAWFYAAPFGTALLADLGARVIKIEGADGDPHRYQNPMREFSGVKALGGKESVVVDYRTPEGKKILHELVAKSDMVMRNYRQQNSVLVGDDYDGLKPANPDQVYLYAGAYGSDGPYTTRPAFAPTMGVAAGHRGYQLGWQSALHHIEEITFDEGMKRLVDMRTGTGGPTNNADAAAGLSVATGMLLGLVAKQRTGSGQYLETSMICSNAYVVSDEFFDFDDRVPHKHHDVDGVSPLYRLYPCAEDGGWVFLAAPLASEWDDLAGALGDLAAVDLAGDRRFGSADARQQQADALAEVLGEAFLQKTAAEWEAALLPRGVACVEVRKSGFSEFTISDPIITENGFTQEVTHTLFGTHHRHGPIVTLSDNPGVVGPGCLVGEQTKAILGELGYTDEQLADLKARNIISWYEPADA
jgi:crotonobetainyl-CoA:carnitine CoA-transferase CaiB-like acyl-CoA transferase